MSNRSGFLSPPAESQHKKEIVRQNSERETQRETSAASTRSSGPDRPILPVAFEYQAQASTPSAISSDSISNRVYRAVPALGSSAIWKKGQRKSRSELMSLIDAYETASSLYARLAETRDPADATWDELCSAREQLQTALDRTTSPIGVLYFKAVRTLADIYGQLGDYDKAQSALLSLCPSLPLTRSDLYGLCASHKIDALLHYLRFSATTGRDLDQAEMAARAIPWAAIEVLRTEHRRLAVLFNLIRILSYGGHYDDASKHLKVFEATSPTRLLDSDFLLQKAIITMGQGFPGEAQALFVNSFVLSSVRAGAWHRQTLDILYYFGSALRAWGQHEAALNLLTKCCQGFYYILGPSHPRSVRVYQELEVCEGANVAMQILHQLGHALHNPQRKWSVAYEHVFLITPIEILKPIRAVDYEQISNILEKLLKDQDSTNRVRFDAQRCIAWCSLEQSKLETASTTFYSLYHLIDGVSSDLAGVETYRAALASDEAICYANTAEDFTRQRSKLVYLGFKDFRRSGSYQVEAVLRRLLLYGLTHFTRDDVFSDPPLITELSRESLGSGTYATVDTVQVGKELYARKSVNLPRQRERQNRLQEDIQKEVQIMNALDYPHIVRVLLTYKETRRFSIIMQPLADCDLEIYLATKTCSTIQERHLVWKWMSCLVNTLVFIHSKGIRHKDIKPRNILVKGEKIYITDFGSGYMFDEGGNSTTDGIAYGHTRAYCAPEVIMNDTRNRSSDVFSLGCVLIEMAVWNSEISMSDYFRGIRADRDSTDTVQYHDSITRISAWFQNTPMLTQRTKDMYYKALVYMIRKKADIRWTAIQASRAICKIVPVECLECGIDFWVSDTT